MEDASKKAEAKIAQAAGRKAQAIASEVSLKGLLVKQLLTPEKFTAEDAAKLKEFQLIQARSLLGVTG